METPTIVKKTKEYLLIRVPLPRQVPIASSPATPNASVPKMTMAEKRLQRILQKSESDLREGKAITAPTITEALRRYEERQWD
ncbi:MAG: hypothetical protein AAB916_00700 [Patescibacteria group bacterium]